MTSALSVLRLAARGACRQCARPSPRRAFKHAARRNAANNYPMPALSPTMTEGNIAGWQVKEGDSYAAGDVLLEIETDKATMDVEAQEDGILMKITSPDGTKGVKVGQRIAVTAEPGDDISSLELPPDDTTAQQSKEAAKSEPKEEGQAQKPQKSETKSNATESAEASGKASNAGKQGGTAQKQTYPLYPSVESILHQNGLSEADAAKIPATGPSGRLLKGDVLAYLGKITKEYPAQSSARLTKLSHLDLSNIQIAPKPEPKKGSDNAASTAQPEPPRTAEVILPISLSAVVETQKRIEKALGIHLSLEDFLTRASFVANDALPLNKNRTLTADELFNAIVGSGSTTTSSNGRFAAKLRPASLSSAGAAPISAPKKQDIIDLLTSSKKSFPRPSGKSASSSRPPVMGENVFTVTAQKGDERRAMVYLERMKAVLETVPERLVHL